MFNFIPDSSQDDDCDDSDVDLPQKGGSDSDTKR